MKIAILGWGSLIWLPKELKFDTNIGWKENGPVLPIEFARISKDGRLTLVITANGTEVPTLYSVSSFDNLDLAVLNLAVREGSGRMSIGYYNKTKDEFSSIEFSFKENIKNWIQTTDFDGVIWTNLPEKWILNDENETKIDPDERVDYLKKLKGNQSALAEEYIRNTPKQIATKYRNQIIKTLGWE
ncbi:hypothetical protein DYBT9275_05370 [Dyadobacter sp. CECT 9275]|uniref:Uncharacterized protein n=1 Tax=Dyadobacter helix TaxID=2822344 RepID=A0A916JHA9_9BACT|nr:hypothetical protein [Dyadobacter sp. CECT 9275]CAG5015606.1 hypothetical protein DYBT9275_05370 [Dyadobacter sp. CECT 9275]